jgi:hypothetical protein
MSKWILPRYRSPKQRLKIKHPRIAAAGTPFSIDEKLEKNW